MRVFPALFFLIVLSIPQLVSAQCTNKDLEKEAKKILKPFSFETMAFVQFKKTEKHPEIMQTTFSVFRNEKYRVAVKPSDFYQEPYFSVYYGEGESRELIFTNKQDKTVSLCDFTAEKAGICTIEFEFNAPLTENDFKPERCLAFMIGYMSK